MNFELKTILFITRRLPKIKGSCFLSKKLRDFYLRKPREKVLVDVNGFKMFLQPGESVSNNACLFYPQLYDWREIEFLKNNLKEGDIFIDIGAHIGFYSLIASGIVGKDGLVFSIEADSTSYERLVYNIELNNIKNIKSVFAGVSDKKEILRLNIYDKSSRGGNSFLGYSPEGVEVQCHPLFDILTENNIHSIQGLKIDIEGFEFRVLSRFFSDINPSLYPKFIITEFHDYKVDDSEGNVLELLERVGYVKIFNVAANYIYEWKK